MDYEKLGKLIKQKRKEKNLTQQKLAKEVGISRQVLSTIENGKLSNLSIRHLETILRLLGYDLCITKHNPFSLEEPFLCKEESE